MLEHRLQNPSFRLLVVFFGTLFLLFAGMMIFAEQASAHGYLENGRAHLCKEKINTGCGEAQWNPHNFEAPKGFPNAGPADGKIAGAGIYGEMDAQTENRWQKVSIQGGPYTFTWVNSAPHRTTNYKYYITKPDWDPNQPITRQQLNLQPFCTIEMGGQQPGAVESHTCNIPSMNGYHVILGVWEIYDTANAFYQVMDVDFGGGGSNEDSEPPTAPSNLRATAKTSSSVTLTWDASTDNVGVTGYRIYQGANQIATVSGLTHTVTGLTPSTAYSFTVRAFDAAGNLSNESNTLQVVTDEVGSVDTEAPTAPEHLHTMGITSTTVSLMWGASTDNVGVTGYLIYQGSNHIATVSGTTLEYDVTGLTPDTTYSFTVRAIDAAGNLSTASNEITVKTTASSSNECSQYPAWDADSIYIGGDRVSYEGKVYEAKWWTQGDRPDQSGEWGVWKFIEDCSDEGNGNGGTDHEPPTAPQHLHTMDITSTTVALMWGASTDNVGVTGYYIYNGSNHIATVSGNTLEYTVTGLNPDTSYTFTVRAIDAAGNVSSPSNSITVTTPSEGNQGGGTAPAWAPGTAYSIGDLVTYNGVTYECLQAHISLIGWEPSAVPALWAQK